MLLNVLLLGKTGRGKSTTGNKLVNADGNNAPNLEAEGKLKREWPPEEPATKVGVDQASVPKRKIRFAAETGRKSVTQECAIIANAAAGFRVMDTRGFAPSDFVDTVYLSNLRIIREVVGIASDEEIIFHRVLYFLPERDIPERADGYLQEELQVLWHFYGDKIFKNMAIVMTEHPRSTSTNPNIDEHFGEGTVTKVQETFLEALENAVRVRKDDRVPPCPDIVFIPFRATAESVAEIVRKAKVRDPNGIRLEFRKDTCSKCASVIHIRLRKDTAFIAGADDEEGQIKIPEESKCHPYFIPKYTRALKVVGGVIHLVTLGIPQLLYHILGGGNTIWPWFTNSEEKCAKCECAPKEKGCTKVGDKYLQYEVQHDHAMLKMQVV